MKKTSLLIGMLFMLVAFTNAQNVAKRTVNLGPQMVKSIANKANISTPIITPKRHCGTMEHLQWMMQQDPTLKQKMELEEKKFDNYIATHQQELENNKTAYTIPCVVHIVYNGSSENISDARVQEQIEQTNLDWSGANGRSMGSFSSSLRANSNITLCLATEDPNGAATTGITRTPTTVSSFSYNDDGVKYASSGGCDAWDPTKYFNIWVCDLGSSLCGYAQFPALGINSTYGVVIHYEYFGLTGASSPYNGGGTLSHEGGHCFNLYHIWGDDNGGCTQTSIGHGSDGCSDTPNQADATYGNHSGVLTDACTSSSPGIMYMNFMDYSDDVDLANVTPNQVTRMQAAVSQYLSGVANNAATACSTDPVAPVAAFTWTPTSPVVNTSVQFTDQSTGSTPMTYAWIFGDGGTSTSQNPTHTYTATGTFNACLTATNSSGSDQACHNVVVVATTPAGCDTILPPSITSCGWDSLGIYYADASPHDSGYVSGSNAYLDKEKAMKFSGVANGTVSDVIVMYGLKAGTSGNTSVKIYSVNGGSPGTLSGTSATIVKSAIDTTNYGLNLNNVYHFSTPVSVSSDFFASVVLPTTWADGTNELAIWSENISCSSGSGTLAYEKWSDNTWHAFSDADVYNVNIDMMIFPVVCVTTTGIKENKLENIQIYPNPANDVLNIDMANFSKNNVKINVYNSIGKLIRSIENKNMSPMIKVDLSAINSGIYYVTIQTVEGTITKKVSIIK